MSDALLPVYDRDLVLVKGKGRRLFDRDGGVWLDFAAGIAVNGFGYGDRKVVSAIKKQAALLIHASNLYHTEPGLALAERLVSLAFPSKVFFCNSGTEAVRGRDEVLAPHRQGAGSHRVRLLRALVPRPHDGGALDHVDGEVPRALRAAGAGGPVLPARTTWPRWRTRSARRPRR